MEIPSISLLSETIDRRRRADRRALLDAAPLASCALDDNDDEDEDAEGGEGAADAVEGVAAAVTAAAEEEEAGDDVAAPPFADPAEEEDAGDAADVDAGLAPVATAAAVFLRPPKIENMAGIQ
jgi:hypothetical protein